MTAIHADAALRHRPQRALALGLAILLALAASIGLTAATRPSPVAAAEGTYRNPLPVETPEGVTVESCADPSVIYNDADDTWYMYCTTDPLHSGDRTDGDFRFHLIPMFSSVDLVNWTYRGDAFGRPNTPGTNFPTWAYPGGGTLADGRPHGPAGLWAPEIDFIDGTWYLFYGVTDMTDAANPFTNTEQCADDNAIGVATAPSPLGPWTDSGDPVVDPRPNAPAPTCNFFWTYDPEVFATPDGSALYIYFGSYYGGVHGRPLTTEGSPARYSESNAGAQFTVTIANRYEGPEVVFRDGFYYLFVSATDCCRGPLTGYSVFAGRSTSPTGPYVDREGVRLDPESGSSPDARVGGTPVISMNGNRWVGPGHNTVLTDFAGQDWTIYHAIDRFDPYFAGAPGFDKRPALLDPVDWVNGWPTVRGGRWASDQPMHRPAAQPGEKTAYRMLPTRADELGQLVTRYSDEFNDTTLSGQWSWVRPPANTASYGEAGGRFRFDTQPADLYFRSNNASVLTEAAPNGNYAVETRLRFNVPALGCCFNFRQAGLVIYGSDDNYVKLVHVSIWETRQTEFAKEHATPIAAGEQGPDRQHYGNTVVGPPGDWTYLRIVRRAVGTRSGGGSEEAYTAYTSRDGVNWVRGGTWTHELGTGARIGLVSMGGPDFSAEFDYVRVYQLHR